MSASPSLSVVTVSWQTGPRLKESVEAVLRAPGVDEYVLVNHGNPPAVDAMLHALAEKHDKLRLVETRANLGFAKGCNIGAVEASGDILLFLNPDAVPTEGVARRLKDDFAALAQNRPAIIGARLLSEDRSEQRGARRGELTPWSAIVGFAGLHRLEGFSRIFRDIHRERESLPDALVETPVVSGAAMAMKRGDFLDLGGFDEGYFLHVEDIDICRRVREAGGDVWFEPGADVLHYGGTSQSSVLFVEGHKARGFVRYFWKFYTGPLERLATLVMIPAMVGAIWARAWYIYGRGRFDFYRLKLKARRRLGRIRKASLEREKSPPSKAPTEPDV